MTVNELSDALYRARMAQGLTQAEVARRMGISRPAVAGLELRYYVGPIGTFQRWAAALGYELSLELRGGPWLPPRAA